MGKFPSSNIVGLKMFQIVGTTLGRQTNQVLHTLSFILEITRFPNFGIGVDIGIGIGFLLSSKWGLRKDDLFLHLLDLALVLVLVYHAATKVKKKQG